MAAHQNDLQEHTLTITGIHKTFGTYQALCDVSFTVNPGEILGLIGPNGSGKSTLLECITGLLPLESGTVTWCSKPLALKDRNRVLWYQPDNILPFADQHVKKTLTFFRNTNGRSQKETHELIGKLELSAILHKPLKDLSKGYKRRVLLAIALLSSQPILMLDEPFDGFDLRQSLTVMNLLREDTFKRTMILSIHQLTEAEKICDRFLLLDQGRLLALGTLSELQQQTNLSHNATLEEIFLAIT